MGSDIIKALDKIKGMVNIFAIMRQNSEESFGKIMNTAVKMAEDMDIAVDKSRIAKQLVYQAGAANDEEYVSNYYIIKMYIPLLDGLCNHLTDRFGLAHQKVLSLMRLILVLKTGNFDTLKLPLNCILNYFQRIMRLTVSSHSGSASGRVVKRLLR